MRAAALALGLLAGCYASTNATSTCPPVEAEYEEALDRLVCPELPETLDACPLACDALTFDAERAASRSWRATPEDLERVLQRARTCEELGDDVEAVCGP